LSLFTGSGTISDVFTGSGTISDEMTRDRFGFELPLLLAGAFRALIDALHVELADHGHPAARPIHGFALQAIGPDGATVSELGRRLGVSKQAAAKTAASLERLGYVVREHHATDARALHLRRSQLGNELLSLSAEVFTRLRAEWARELGAERIAELEDDLERIAVAGGAKLGDLPGWLR
jgi:DNA-binding MarR family transcriptional regulator